MDDDKSGRNDRTRESRILMLQGIPQPGCIDPIVHPAALHVRPPCAGAPAKRP
jgi:hypothetical protein